MTRDELQEAITETIAKIEEVKKEIVEATEPLLIRRLVRKKRELQYLQLWHFDQLKWME